MIQTSSTIRRFASLAGTVIAVVLVACGAFGQSVFFDDFNYSSSNDPVLLNFGWSPRSGGGGPGIGTWDPTHITFLPDPADSSNQLMQMAATTSGTAGTTIQTEILTPFNFLHGTFAARVKFEDAPESGPDGDQLYQTFFTISPYKSRPYSEIDFEYLPDGYGSVKAPHFFLTLWQTTHKSVSTNIAASYSGHPLGIPIAWPLSQFCHRDPMLGKSRSASGTRWWWTTPMGLTPTFTLMACLWRHSRCITPLPSWPSISTSGFPPAASSIRRHPAVGWNRSIGCITPKIRCLRHPRSRLM